MGPNLRYGEFILGKEEKGRNDEVAVLVHGMHEF